MDEYQELFMNAKIEIENNVPIILSQGLDIGDDGAMFDTSMECDSEKKIGSHLHLLVFGQPDILVDTKELEMKEE